MDRNEIERNEIKKVCKEYSNKSLHIGIFGSHSALPTAYAAKKAKIPSIVFTKKGREKTYLKHNKHLFDKVIVLNEWKEIASDKYQDFMREKNVVFIPNRSFVVYTGLKNIEESFYIPVYGSRKLLRAEERNSDPPRNQYFLLEKAGIRYPKIFDSYEKIDRLSVVKVQQKENPLERAYFYPSSPEEYREKAEEKLRKGEISKKGLKEATIEEFVVGPMLNANFHFFASENYLNEIDLLGFSDREQTNETGFRKLPAKIQKELEEKGFTRTNEEICHRGKTLRESKLEKVYEYTDSLKETFQEYVPPGHIGPIGIQGAIPINEEKRPEFVVFDLSFRVPGDPAMGPTSPYLNYLNQKHSSKMDVMPTGWSINQPLDLSMMEIKRAAENGRLESIVT